MVDINGATHVLIPKFNLGLEGGGGQRDWERFLSELCEFPGLPLEQEDIPEKDV